MEKKNQPPEVQFPINYREKIKSQNEVVEKISKIHQNNPSGDSARELERERDLLYHYSNASKENPKERVEKAAEFAKKTALNRAVQQVG